MNLQQQNWTPQVSAVVSKLGTSALDIIERMHLLQGEERLQRALLALDNAHTFWAAETPEWRALARQVITELAHAYGIRLHGRDKAKARPTRSKSAEAPDLFAKLNADACARAQLLPLFASPERLAYKPRCSDAKDCSVIRTAQHAVARRYIEPNAPTAYYRLVFDLDWHDSEHPLRDLSVRYLNDRSAWEAELGVPAPSWAAISPGTNSAHLGYELQTPVGRHEHARAKPLQYLAAVESAMTVKLAADDGFVGALCKNPLNTDWEFYRGRELGFELAELSEYLDLSSAKFRRYCREPRGGVGRNVYMFDAVRFWSYDHVAEYRSGGYDRWEAAVIRQAEAVNARGFDHLDRKVKRTLLPLSECRSVGKSVARWTWTHHGQRVLTEAYRELQAWRGTRGAAAAAKVKRDRREEEIVAAIRQLTAQGVLPTMRKVAQMVGCSQPALSKHYRHHFQGTAH